MARENTPLLTIPQAPKRTKPVTVMFDPETLKRVKEAAKEHKAPVSTTIYHIVQTMLPDRRRSA